MPRDTLSLEDWKDLISSFEKLEIKEAQELYIKALSVEDTKLKKAYMDELISGTLYVIYNYVKENKLEMFTTSTYDINDIMNSFIEVWTKKMYKGALLSVNKFSLILTRSFFNEVYRNLGGENVNIFDLIEITFEDFAKLFDKFIKLKNKGSKFSAKDIVGEGFQSKNSYYYYYTGREQLILWFFEKIYENLDLSKIDDLDITPTKISNWLRLIVSAGIQVPISDNQAFEPKIDDKIFLEHFVDEVDANLNPKARQIIHLRFGLDDGRPRYLKETAQDSNLSQVEVRQIEAKALRELRSTATIRKYHN